MGAPLNKIKKYETSDIHFRPKARYFNLFNSAPSLLYNTTRYPNSVDVTFRRHKIKSGSYTSKQLFTLSFLQKIH